MARLRISIDLGPRTAPEVLAGILADVVTVSQASRLWANHEVRAASEQEIFQLATRNPDGLRERAVRLERSDAESEIADLLGWAEIQYSLRKALLDPEFRHYIRRGYRDLYLPPDVIPAAAWLVGRPQPAPPLVGALVAEATLRGLGDGPDVESLVYSNPLELVLAATGGVLLALRQLLIVARDWPARRRIGNAAASEAEANVALQAEFRRFLLEQYTSGRLVGDPWEIEQLLGASPIESMARLAALDARVEDLPDDVNESHDD